jgi:hypothetical protein
MTGKRPVILSLSKERAEALSAMLQQAKDNIQFI